MPTLFAVRWKIGRRGDHAFTHSPIGFFAVQCPLHAVLYCAACRARSLVSSKLCWQLDIRRMHVVSDSLCTCMCLYGCMCVVCVCVCCVVCVYVLCCVCVLCVSVCVVCVFVLRICVCFVRTYVRACLYVRVRVCAYVGTHLKTENVRTPRTLVREVIINEKYTARLPTIGRPIDNEREVAPARSNCF